MLGRICVDAPRHIAGITFLVTEYWVIVWINCDASEGGRGMSVAQDDLNNATMEFTKRVLRRSALAQGFWLGLAGVIAILVISGPFTTAEVMSLSDRAIYWCIIAVFTYFCAVGVAAAVYAVLHPRIANWKLSGIIAGLIAGIPVAVFVVVVNAYVVPVGYGNLGGYAELALSCVFVTIVGTFMHQAVNTDLRQIRPEAGTLGNLAAPIFKRLDPNIRAEVVSLHAQGHYVEVTTRRGKQLVLMRLKNAIAELGPDCGRQVHRSWWVCNRQAQTAHRSGGRVVLQLVDGREVPVSRYNLKEIRRWIASQAQEP